MTQNQRRHKRYDIEDVHGTLAYNLDARVLNISLTGMAIETESLLKVGEGYNLNIPRPEGQLRVQADVQWCHLVRTERTESGEVKPVYRAGVDFRSILDEKATQMLRFIEANVVVDLEKRLFGRFHLEEDRAVDLDRNEQFVVRKISLSGMMIETSFIPRQGTVYPIEVRFDSTTLETGVRIVHARKPEDEEGPVEVGVEFVNLEADGRKKIETLIEALLE